MTPSNPRPAAFGIGFPLATAIPLALKKLPSWLLAACLLLAALWLFPTLAAAQQSTVPGAPTDFSASRGTTHRQVLLAWRPPEATGGSPITQYVINYAENANFPQNATTAETLDVEGTPDRLTKKIASLDRGTRYYFRVAAVNANGQGAWSVTENATPSPVITVAAVNKTITEGASAEFRVRLWPAPKSNTRLTVEISAEGSYGDIATSKNVTVRRNENSREFTIGTTDDASHEPDGLITVRVSRHGGYAVGNPRTAKVSITNDDENQAPTVTGDGNIPYDENDTIDVGTFTASDPDEGSILTWTVDGADATSFTIIDGTLRFIAPPNYETQTTYTVTVIATDNGDPAMYGTKAVTVTITDVNDPPRFTSSNSFSMGENQTLLGTVTASDDDSTDSAITYILGGTDADLFERANDGSLSFLTAPDFETPQGGANDDSNTYELSITATSGTGDRELTTIQNLTVTVTNVNEAPEVTGDSAIDYDENGTAAVAAYSVSDPDAGSIHDWTLDGADEASFTIIDGTLRFIAPPNYETQTTYAVTVIATDNGEPALSDTIPVTVTITDLNEAPRLVLGLSVAENDTLVGNVLASDEDSGDSVTELTLRGTDAELFQLAADGSLSFRSAPDFENPQGGSANDSNTYALTVTATSGTGTRIMIATQNLTVTVTNVNEAPTVSGDGTITHDENDDSTTYSYTVTDPDAGSTHTWTVEGIDHASFSITNGVLSFRASPDFETKSTFLVTVKATDSGAPALSHGIAVTITITDANEAPTFSSGSSFSIAENGAAVGNVSATDEDSADSVTYALSGADESLFAIANDGVLSFRSAPDFESPQGGSADDSNSYELTVTATGGTGDRALTATQNLTVTVTNVNEEPVVSGQSAVDYAENGTDAVATYTVSDPDAGSSHTWTLEGTDEAAFSISESGALSFTTPPDFETQSTYSVTVKATDNGTPAKSGTIDVTVTITNLNEEPEVSGQTTVDYAENGEDAVATYTVTDPDADSEHSWTVEGIDHAAFTLINSVLSFTTPPDFETKSTYEVTVKATDNGTPALSDTITVTISVTDVNEEPTVSGEASIDYAENRTDAVATYTVTDPDAGGSHTWTLEGTDEAAFSITDGVLSFTAPPDFETKSDYSVTVTATDNGTPAMSGSKSVTVTITDLNEKPKVKGKGTVNYDENGSADVATYTVTDPDADSSHGWSVKGPDAAAFAISDGVLSFITPPDFETKSAYSVTVVATDDGTPAKSDTKSVTVTITDLNEEPEVNGDGDIFYAENGEDAVATYTVTDPDAGDTHEWTLEGADNAAFSIDNGVLSFITPPDFETKSAYSVTVVATDDGTPALSDTIAVTVTITDLNENVAPTVSGDAAVPYAEKSDSAVHTYSVSDDDAEDTHEWTLEGADNAAFTITNGVLSFKTPPDFETKSTYSVTVKATDNGTPALSDTIDVTVTITNVNEEPQVNGDATVNFAENGTNAVATYTVTDPDAGSSHTWSVEGTDHAAFSITNGVLSFTTPPNFETKSLYEVTVKATDNGSPEMSGTKTVNVTITDLNEEPQFTSGNSFSLAENGTAVGNVSASDEDSADSVTYALSGTDANLFTIANNGALSFKAAPNFEAPQGGSADDSNSYELTVTATSGTGTRAMTATQNLTVTVTNVNEPPTVDGENSIDYTENGTDDVAAYSVTDPDAGSSHTWSLEGANAASFSITNGVLSFTTLPDYETQTSYSVTVKATDDGSPALSDTISVSVTITDVPTSYRQVRIWTGRNLDNDDDVLLITVGAWSTNPNPNDAADITSETTTETGEDGRLRSTITYTDNNGNYAYQRTDWYEPERQQTQYRERRAFTPGCGSTYGSWSTSSNPPSAPSLVVRATGQWVDHGGGTATPWRAYFASNITPLFNGRPSVTNWNPSQPSNMNCSLEGSQQSFPPDSTYDGPTPAYTTSIQTREVMTAGETPVYTPAAGPTENLTHISRRERQ